MLLSVTIMIIISSLSFDDILGQTFAVYILTIAGAESAIGLGILVAYYRLRGSSIVSGFFGRKVGVTGAHIITCASVITTTILAVIAFFLTFMMIILVTGHTYLIMFFTSRITHLITSSYGRSYSSISFNTRSYYGYSRCLFINEIITINRI
ncbi:hypothetical protein N7456_013274 [Penicillium angulare]|uniref:NADH-ubiquinone oxidoreductase chain 4L n=1 Tax=Penicillium angulare TaxID=116970 RepID=A0A9W9EHR9_9EURO|nr:hypothetical protein N7456_013274 [Penicillium angulare]